MSDLPAISVSSSSVGESFDGPADCITVVLGHFDVLLGRGLAQILREDRSVRIVAADLDRAALEQAVAAQAPRVAILDEASVGARSILERLRAAQPTIGIVVLAHLPTIAYGMSLLADEVSCVAKESSAENVLAAVHIAADGRRVFAADDGHLVEQNNPATVASLTPRETEVLEYISRGRSHGEIAQALQLGVETVRTHSAHIRDKFGVRRNRDLIGVPIPARLET
ncbi:MAG TPA: response regulator transcription factor [Solirubrobacteraceae bacterium]